MENQVETLKAKQNPAFRKLNLSRRSSVSFGDLNSIRDEKTKEKEPDPRQIKSADIYKDRTDNSDNEQRAKQRKSFEEFGAQYKKRRPSLPALKVATKNPVITEITADFSDKQEAEKFCEILAKMPVPTSVTSLDSGRRVSICSNTEDSSQVKKLIVKSIPAISSINDRIKQLDNEIKFLENKSRFTKYWYGYELKKQKSTSLGKLKERILSDSSKTAGQHCQAIRKEAGHQLLNYGFFSRRTWTMLNTIENDERAVLSPRKP